VYVPYIDVNEDEINVSDEDAKRYFNAHKEDFSQEEGRNIEFINFPLAPSESDREGVRAELASLSFEWLNVEDDSVFVNQHSDVRFQSEYYTTTELVGTGLDTLVDGQSVGFQKGPIDLGGAFAVVKLVDRKTVPDSVKARHILIPFAGATRADASVTRNPQEAKVLADIRVSNDIKIDLLLTHAHACRAQLCRKQLFSNDVVPDEVRQLNTGCICILFRITGTQLLHSLAEFLTRNVTSIYGSDNVRIAKKLRAA
ncbi:peptidyl-prolyl cis-trans isomerase, partial [Schleiferiaceae bacterium]|nr:peptidyl-prolyl cis-trans isomerase [Schleiferiaceae bacterium]